jgi:hypothetical protein
MGLNIRMGANMVRTGKPLSAHACIETLESRRLLSASPVAHALPALGETHAVKVKKKVPAIGGKTYFTIIKEPGITVDVGFEFSSETAKGVLSGQVSEGFTGGEAIFPCTGTVTLARNVTFHTAAHAPPLHLTAKLSADLTKLTGKVFLHGPHAAATRFSATLYTAP